MSRHTSGIAALLLRSARLILAGRATRARHNDFDFACAHWWGDRNPALSDQRNRDFGGAPVGLTERRCLVCRPFTDQEGGELLEPRLPEDVLRHWTPELPPGTLRLPHCNP